MTTPLIDRRDREIAELKQIIADLLYVSEYDFDNCGFGPAYGINRDRQAFTLSKARKLSKGVEPSWFKEQFGV